MLSGLLDLLFTVLLSALGIYLTWVLNDTGVPVDVAEDLETLLYGAAIE